MHDYDEDDDRHTDDIWGEVGAIKNSAAAEFKAGRLWLGARFTPPASFLAMKPNDQKVVLQRMNGYQLPGSELSIVWDEQTARFNVVAHELPRKPTVSPQPA